MRHLIPLCIILSVVFFSCKETMVQNPVEKGSLSINSNPQGAKIFIQGTFDNHYTPYTFNDLSPDNYEIKIEVEPGVDSTFSVDVKSNLTTSKSVDFFNKMGKCYFHSDPQGAEIFLDNINTNLLTPAIVGYLSNGMHNYKLQLNNNIIEDSFYVSQGQLENVYENFNFVPPTGSIFIVSSPQGAGIILDGTNTGKVTPDSVTNVSTGQHSMTLSLSGYQDTTVSVIVQGGLQTAKFIQLTSTLSTTMYGPVRLYETAGTTAAQPAGLDLSAGIAYVISGSDNDKVDIYYSTSGTGGTPYLLQSADLYPNLTRQTAFNVGGGSIFK